MENIKCKYAVGVDIGGTAIKIGLFDIAGELIEKREIVTNHDNNCSSVLQDTADEILNMLKRRALSIENVIGIGIGIPGPVADNKVLHCVNLHWKNAVDAAGIMKELTGIRAIAINDANAAGLGELWRGGAKSFESIVLVTIGTGIGGAIIEKGRLITGFSGAAGEIGHITVVAEGGRSCNCGKCGCLETYASATGIVKTAEELLNSGESSILEKDRLTARLIFDAAKAGDKTATMTIEAFGKYLGMALANIAVVTNPQAIVISGGVANAGGIVCDIVRKYFNMYAFKSVENTDIIIAELHNNAGIYGAAYAAIQSFAKK